MQTLLPFPPIWSDLRLTIRYDGTYTGELFAHSLFPSLTYYENSKVPCLVTDGSRPCRAYDKKSGYDGMPNLDRWMNEGKGWGKQNGYAPAEGNPWGGPRRSRSHLRRAAGRSQRGRQAPDDLSSATLAAAEAVGPVLLSQRRAAHGRTATPWGPSSTRA